MFPFRSRVPGGYMRRQCEHALLTAVIGEQKSLWQRQAGEVMHDVRFCVTNLQQ